MELKDAIEIERPPEQVWEWLSDFDKKKLWMKGLLEETWTEGVPGVKGSRFEVKIKEGPGVSVYEGTVVDAVKPRRFRTTMSGGCGKEQMTMEIEYRLVDRGGRTTVEYACEPKMKVGGFVKLLMPLFTWFAKKQAKSFHRNLKKLAEAA
jgi:uncharacterized protein YndB with AHSA1/START domain